MCVSADVTKGDDEFFFYIFQNDVVGGYAIGCDEEEVLWRGRRVDVTDLAFGK